MHMLNNESNHKLFEARDKHKNKIKYWKSKNSLYWNRKLDLAGVD